jgi:GST-like protein
MIDLYYWPTPNGHKITIFLEETGLPYTIKAVNIAKGEQFEPAFRKIAPNTKIPAIVDHAPLDGGAPLSLFESGAILEYLAEKTGRFLPHEFRARWECKQWLYWQMSGLGPFAGQNHHFRHYAPEPIPYAIDRYVRETGRLYAVMNKLLADRAFMAGDYSIADIACYPWVLPERQAQNMADFPNLARWKADIAARPAVVRAYAVAQQFSTQPTVPDDVARSILFGQSKETVR